jgi:hypothetical protein
MMKVLSGDWPAGSNAFCQGKLLHIHKSAFKKDKMFLVEIVSAQTVSKENDGTVGKSLGWGAAGALLLGPVGAIIGGVAASRSQDQVVAVIFKDGRKVLLHGKPKEFRAITAAGFQWAIPAPAPSEPKVSQPVEDEDPELTAKADALIEGYRIPLRESVAPTPRAGQAGRPPAIFGRRPNR